MRVTEIVMVVVLILGGTASASVVDSITHGSTTINMDFVTVGDPGNTGHRINPYDGGRYGAVGYTYRIGKYEVSENQWDAVSSSANDLLNNPGYWNDNQPVAGISWNEAAMFTNWLTSGDVTSGVYAVDGNGIVTGIDRASAKSTYGAVYFLPTQDEWYKAAYYDPDKPGGAGYWDYPTKHDNSSGKPDGIDFAGDTTFDAVFRDGYDQGQPNSIDNAGLLSAYGTMAQGGNVYEWTETEFSSFPLRVTRGGGWGFGSVSMDAETIAFDHVTIETFHTGFRVASSAAVPEPGSLIVWSLIGLTFAGIGWYRRRKM